MALRVIFADDNFLVREGVSALLAEVDDIELHNRRAEDRDAAATGGSSPPRLRNQGASRWA